jgi:hypothetical protein
MWISITAGEGPEGRQRVAHGVSRGIERQLVIISGRVGEEVIP